MKKFYITLIVCLLPLIASGQALRGSYFSEYSIYRNKMNPAFTPRSSYLGFAAIDNLGLGLTGNIGAADFIYPSGDKMLTFMHPDVSSETFLNNLPANPHFDVDVDTDILNLGFFTGKNSFWTIGLGIHADAEFNIPKELFTFLKNGAAADPQVYNIRNTSLIANAYAELSLGYSHDFSDLVKGLRAGARVKFLAGLAKADVRINNLNLTMGSEMWSVAADASAYLALKGANIGLTEDKKISGFDYDMSQMGLAGMGAAFDFGVEYRLYINRFFDSVRFSASVTDLGFINYGADGIQQFKSAGGTVQYEGLNDITFGEEMNFQETVDQIKDEFMQMIDYDKVASPGAVHSRIRPNLYVGAEVPFLWNRMSLGLLYNAKFGYTSTRNELTLALNMRPGKWFNLGVNYSMLNAAKSVGWLIEFIPRSGIGCFIGSDYTFMEVFKVSSGSDGMFPIYAPLNEVNFNFRLGCYITMGNKYDDIAQAKRDRKEARREARRNR